MHLQMRTTAKHSPPDVEKVLAALAKVDLAGLGGSNVEFGGELAIAPKDGQEDAARSALRAAGYAFRELEVGVDDDLTLLKVKDAAGGLHAELAKVAAANLATGRIIRDILVGIPDADDVAAGVIPVQVYSEQVRTPNAM